MKNLSKLEIGGRGKVLRVNCEGALRRRLLDMGITPGTEITVKKAAPLGDPIEIELRGYFLTIRKEDASKIIME